VFNTITSDELIARLTLVRSQHEKAQQSSLKALREGQAAYDAKIIPLETRQSAIKKVIDSAQAAGLQPPLDASQEISQIDIQIAELRSARESLSAPSADPLPLLAASLDDLKFFFSKQDRKPDRILECDDLQRGIAALLHPQLSLTNSGTSGRTKRDFPGYRDAASLFGKTFALNAGTKWCVSGQIPEELSWVKFDTSGVASSASKQAHDSEISSVDALFDPETCQFYMLGTTCNFVSKTVWQFVYELQRHDHVPVETKDLSIAAFVHDVSQMIDEALVLNEAAGGMSLDGLPPENPILRCIYDFAKARLIPESEVSFKQVEGQLSLAESRALVLPHLTALRDAPWSAAQHGDIALLKHVLGTRSPVYAWNEGLEGLFGFRVRSSDHTWIRGELYVAPDCVPAIRGTPGHVDEIRTPYGENDSCRVGAAWIRVWQTK
jgi:hypothetical protein